MTRARRSAGGDMPGFEYYKKKGAGLGSYTYHYAYRVQTENKQKDV